MSFSTWQVDDCDTPDWGAIESAIQTVAQQSVEIAQHLQAPADATVAYAGKVELQVRRRLDSTARKLVEAITLRSGSFAAPLLQQADAVVDAAKSCCCTLHLAALGTGQKPPVLPSELGSPIGQAVAGSDSQPALPAMDPVTGGPVAVMGHTATPSVTDLPPTIPQPVESSAVHVYMDAPGVVEVVEELPLPSEPAEAAVAAVGQVPVDLDQPLAFLFGERSASWHPRAIAWSGKWLADMVAAPSLRAWIDARLAQAPNGPPAPIVAPDLPWD